MRTITLLFVLSFYTLLASQPVKTGIVLKSIPGHRVGDTIPILGAQLKAGINSYLYHNYSSSYLYTPHHRILLLADSFSFWEESRFLYRLTNEVEYKWPIEDISLMEGYSSTFIAGLYEDNLFVEDELLRDYLQAIILDIFPGKLIKSKPRNLTIGVVHSLKPYIFSLDNGTIMLSTGLLARLDSEWELKNALARQVAHVVLDHQLDNVLTQQKPFYTPPSSAEANEGEYFGFQAEDVERWQGFGLPNEFLLQMAGAVFTDKQKVLARILARDYMAQASPTGKADLTTASSHRFTLIRSAALMRVAWNLFDIQQYSEVIPLVDSLLVTDAAPGETYYLKAKTYRMMYADSTQMREALGLLELADRRNTGAIPADIEAEKGLLYLRLDDKRGALKAFQHYRARLEAIQEESDAISQQLIWTRQMIMKIGHL